MARLPPVNQEAFDKFNSANQEDKKQKKPKQRPIRREEEEDLSHQERIEKRLKESVLFLTQTAPQIFIRLLIFSIGTC